MKKQLPVVWQGVARCKTNLLLLNKMECISGNDNLFVGVDHPHGNFGSGRRDEPFFAAASLQVERLVDFDAHIGETLADLCAQIGLIFAKSAGEDQGVEAAERGDIAADRLDDLIGCLLYTSWKRSARATTGVLWLCIGIRPPR